MQTVELLFYGTTALFLCFRACQPEIFWGEKPMDFTFLNFFIRLRDLPPQDPWAAGHLMQYYYFGTYLIAMLHKMTRLDPAIGYNLAIGTLAGLFVSCGYTAILAICRRRIFAGIGSLALLLLSDWEAFNLTFFQSGKNGFDLFWASSRIMPPAIANEYPLWSFLFADLHAHLIALPFTLALVALSLRLLGRDKKRFTVDKGAHLALLGLTWGALLMINSWDFISYGFVLGLLFAMRPFLGGRRRFVSWATRGAATLAVACLAILPFLRTLDSGGQNNGIQLERYAFFSDGELLRYLGQFALPALMLAGWLAYRHRPRRWGRRWMPLLMVEAVWLLNLAFKWSGIDRFPWSGALAVTVPIFIGAALLFPRRIPRRLKAAGFLIFAAGMLAWFGEFFFVRERLNSLFKLCIPLWTLFGIALAGLLPYLWFLIRRSLLFGWRGRIRRQLWPSTMGLTMGIFVAAAVVGGVIDILIMTSFQRTEGPRWTLDGLAYLRKQNPEELALIRYLRDDVPGQPRIAEAWGDPYGPFTRISMNTGLPTWLGWEHHVKQRGLPVQEVERRRNELREIYTTTDAEQAYRLLSNEKIELVIFGSLERQTYGAAGERKFQESPHFERLANFGNETAYRVKAGSAPGEPPRATASQN